jgi:hypothetical protein
MDCSRVVFSGHALRRMFERGLGTNAILDTIKEGEVIADYPDDRPYPSFLLLGTAAEQPIHVVVAHDAESGSCFVVTAYHPEPGLWSDDFKTRR